MSGASSSRKCDVLVTGAAGFIGRYMCEHLSRRGLSVLGIDKRGADLPCELVQHDLTAPFPGRIEAAVCVHLASSVGGILFNNAAKADMHAYNAAVNEGTVNLLRSGGCRRMVFFSSINVFEGDPAFEHGPIRTPPKATAYAASKAEGEQVLAEAFEHFIAIRPTNVYGKNQIRSHVQFGESHVIPDLMKKIADSEVVDVMGDGSQMRNFVHVIDVVEFVANNLGLSGRHYFNLRSDVTISIRELADQLSSVMKKPVRFKFEPAYMKLETLRIRDFDHGAAASAGWAPRVQSITAGLQE